MTFNKECNQLQSMRVLVACEFSGTVRDAFIARGHEAMSCDLLPSETPGPHYQGDIFDIVNGIGGKQWDLMIAHPPCTYLCNSGVRWLHEREGRWAEMIAGAVFFRNLLTAPIPYIAIENPIMHGYGQQIIGIPPTQSIQPWQFGHGETKRTCLWLKNLPPLTPTNIVAGRTPKIHHASPGPNRWRERSRTYQGIAEAMAMQWG